MRRIDLVKVIGNPLSDRIVAAREPIAVVRVQTLHTVASASNTSTWAVRWRGRRGVDDLVSLSLSLIHI